jgi:hypothetical protein
VLGNQIDGRQGWMRVYGDCFTAHPFRQSAIPYVLSTIVVNRRAVVSSLLWGGKRIPLRVPAPVWLTAIAQVLAEMANSWAISLSR